MATSTGERETWLDRLYRAAERWPAVNPEELEALTRQLDRMARHEQPDLLFGVFAEARGYLSQEYVGLILARLNPPCPHPLCDVLRRVLPRWDPSVEQLAHYLDGIAGRGPLLIALEEVERCGGVDRAQTDAIRYWLRSTDQSPDALRSSSRATDYARLIEMLDTFVSGRIRSREFVSEMTGEFAAAGLDDDERFGDLQWALAMFGAADRDYDERMLASECLHALRLLLKDASEKDEPFRSAAPE